MSADGIVLATLAAALLGMIGWNIWRRLTPLWNKTPEQLAADEKQQRNDTFYLCVADQVITTTAKTGRSSWL